MASSCAGTPSGGRPCSRTSTNAAPSAPEARVAAAGPRAQRRRWPRRCKATGALESRVTADPSDLFFKSGAALQSTAKDAHHAVDGFDVLDRQPIGEAVDPGGLQTHGRIECLSPLVGQHDKLRPPVMGIGLEVDQPISLQIIDDSLHVLAIGAEITREPRDRLCTLGLDDRTEDLPASA